MSFLDRLHWRKPSSLSDGLTFIDTLVYIIVFQSFIIAAPYVYRQFAGVKSLGDVVWRASLDILILCLWLLTVYVLHSVLKKILRWANS